MCPKFVSKALIREPQTSANQAQAAPTQQWMFPSPKRVAQQEGVRFREKAACYQTLKAILRLLNKRFYFQSSSHWGMLLTPGVFHCPVQDSPIPGQRELQRNPHKTSSTVWNQKELLINIQQTETSGTKKAEKNALRQKNHDLPHAETEGEQRVLLVSQLPRDPDCTSYSTGTGE